jgi:hypothetical protein
MHAPEVTQQGELELPNPVPFPAPHGPQEAGRGLACASFLGMFRVAGHREVRAAGGLYIWVLH